MRQLEGSVDEFFMTRVTMSAIRAQLDTISNAGRHYFSTKSLTVDEINRTWDAFRTSIEKIRKTPFITLIQEYLTEQVSAASVIFKTILRKNSEDSEEWSRAVQRQKELFRQINEIVITLNERCFDDRTGRINMEYISKCCDQFHILRKAITRDLDIIFRNALVSDDEAADARSRCCGHVHNCICALSPPSEIAERVGKYNFWRKGHHVLRFRQILESTEQVFRQIFPGFMVRIELKEVVQQEQRSPGSARSGRSITPLDRSDEIARLLKENAMLKERIRQLEAEIETLKKQLELAQALATDDDVSKDAQYLRQKNDDLEERNGVLETDILRLQGLVQALYSRLRANEKDNTAALTQEILMLREERDKYALAVQQLKDLLNKERTQHKQVLMLPSGDGQLIKDNIQLRATAEKVINENEELQQKDRKRRKYKEGMTASNDHLTELQRELNESREKAQNYDELEEQNRKLQQELNKLKRKSSMQEHEIERLKLEAGASEEADRLRQENLGMKKDNKLLRDDNERKDASLKELQGELSKLKALNDTRKQKKKQLKLDLADAHDSEERLKKQIENLKKLLDEDRSRDDVGHLKEHIEKLRKQKKALQDREAQLSEKVTEQELLIKKLQGSDKSDILNQEIMRLKKAKNELKEKLGELEKRNDELETLIKQLQSDERVNHLMRELDKLKQQKKEAKEKEEELTRTVTEQELMIQRLQKNRDADELSEDLEKMKKENARLKEKVANQDAQIQELSTENDELQQKLLELKKLRKENDEQKAKLQSLEDENQEISNENKDLKAANTDLKTENDELKARLRNMDDLEETGKGQTERIDELTTENKRLKKKIAELTQAGKDQQEAAEETREKLGRMKERMNELGSSMRDLEEENDALKGKLDKMSKIRESDKEKSKRIAELESTMKDMADSSELDQMQKENQALRDQINRLQEEIAELTAKLAAKTSYADEAFQENQAISAENDDLTAQVKQLTQEKEVFDDVRAVIDKMKEIKKAFGALKKACSDAPEDQQLVTVNGEEMDRTDAEKQIEKLKTKFTKLDKKWNKARANVTLYELEIQGIRLQNLSNNYHETVESLRDLRKDYTELLNAKLKLDSKVRAAKYGSDKVVEDAVKKVEKIQRVKSELEGQLEDIERITFTMEQRLNIESDEENEDLPTRLSRVADVMNDEIEINMYSKQIEE